jgi:hypothetical protein
LPDLAVRAAIAYGDGGAATSGGKDAADGNVGIALGGGGHVAADTAEQDIAPLRLRPGRVRLADLAVEANVLQRRCHASGTSASGIAGSW